MGRRALIAGVTIAQALATAVLAFVCASAFWSLLPLALGMKSTVIMSGSMAPGIRAGDVVVSSPASVSELRPGAVVLFVDPARPERSLLHRYVTRDAAGRLVTKGDANAEPDSTPVPAEFLHGQGRVRIPFAGLPAYWLATGQRAHLTGWSLMLVMMLVIAVSGPPAAAAGTRAWRPRHRADAASRRRHAAGRRRLPPIGTLARPTAALR